MKSIPTNSNIWQTIVSFSTSCLHTPNVVDQINQSRTASPQETSYSIQEQSGESLSDHECLWLDCIVVVIVSETGRMLPTFPLCVYLAAHITIGVKLTVTGAFLNVSVKKCIDSCMPTYKSAYMHTYFPSFVVSSSRDSKGRDNDMMIKTSIKNSLKQDWDKMGKFQWRSKPWEMCNFQKRITTPFSKCQSLWPHITLHYITLHVI